MPTRRSLLKRGAEAATLSSLVALAGCTDSLNGGGDGSDGDGGGSDAPAYADAMYDPGSLVDVSNRAFFSYDLGAMYDLRDRLPERYRSEFEKAARQAKGFDPAKVGRMTGVAGGSVGSDGSDVEAALGSVAVTGSFDPDVLGEQVTAAGSVESAGSHAGYDLYTGTTDSAASGALALGADAVFVGGSSRTDLAPTKPVTAMVDAASDDGSGYYRANDAGRRLMDRLSGSLSLTGVEVNTDLVEREMSGDDQMAKSLFSGLHAAGTSTTVDDDDATSDLVLLYAEGEAPSTDDVEALVELARSRGEFAARFGDVSVDRTGSRVTVSATQSTAKLFERPGEAAALLAPGVAVVGAFALDLGSSVGPGPGGDRRPVQAGATVEFDDEADEVVVTFTSTADTDTELRVVAAAKDGASKQAVLDDVGDSTALSFPDGSRVLVRVLAKLDDQRTVVLEQEGRL